jgi:hypothetical protein
VKVLGILSGKRSGLFELGAASLYAVGWILGANYFWLALTAFAITVVMLAIGSHHEQDRKRARIAVAMVSAAFVLPALLILGRSKLELAERDRFHSYLSEHSCTYAGEAVVGMSQGGCRYEECVGPEPIEVRQYFCAATGHNITFTGFKEGAYGR